MKSLEVLHFPDPRLRKIAEPVKSVDKNKKNCRPNVFYNV